MYLLFNVNKKGVTACRCKADTLEEIIIKLSAICGSDYQDGKTDYDNNYFKMICHTSNGKVHNIEVHRYSDDLYMYDVVDDESLL